MPAAPVAPPPSAPAAAPKAAPSPNSKPAAAASPKPAAPTPPPESNDPFNDAFAELDSMESGKPAPKKEAKKDVQNPTAAKPAEKDDDSSLNGEEDTTVTPASKDDGKPKGEEAKPVKAAELRTAYESLKEKVKKEYEPKLQKLTQLEKKVQELETKTPELDKAQQERVAALEKRNTELEAAIRFKDYEKSKEYQDAHWKPLENAWSSAIRELKGLTMKVDDPATGDSVTREVTHADLQYFASLDPAVRRTEINRLFPEDKEEVKRHINTIAHLTETAEAAKEKAKAEAETHAKTQSEEQVKRRQEISRTWKEYSEQLVKKRTEFAKVEGDDEGNALLDRGEALADAAMNPEGLTPEKVALLPKALRELLESGKPVPQKMVIQARAIAHKKAANHDRLLHQNKTLTARVAELEQSLKDYETSGPDGARAGMPGGQSGELTADQELEAMERQFGR